MGYIRQLAIFLLILSLWAFGPIHAWAQSEQKPVFLSDIIGAAPTPETQVLFEAGQTVTLIKGFRLTLLNHLISGMGLLQLEIEADPENADKKTALSLLEKTLGVLGLKKPGQPIDDPVHMAAFIWQALDFLRSFRMLYESLTFKNKELKLQPLTKIIHGINLLELTLWTFQENLDVPITQQTIDALPELSALAQDEVIQRAFLSGDFFADKLLEHEVFKNDGKLSPQEILARFYFLTILTDFFAHREPQVEPRLTVDQGVLTLKLTYGLKQSLGQVVEEHWTVGRRFGDGFSVWLAKVFFERHSQGVFISEGAPTTMLWKPGYTLNLAVTSPDTSPLESIEAHIQALASGMHQEFLDPSEVSQQGLIDYFRQQEINRAALDMPWVVKNLDKLSDSGPHWTLPNCETIFTLGLRT